VAIVPARAGSKGLPGKNVRLLGGSPLYRRAIDQAREAGLAHIVVTTDLDEILTSDLGDDVKVRRRPPGLCGDDVPMAPVLVDVIDDQGLQCTDVVLLQPTSPLRTAGDISACVELFRRGRFELVMSVCPADASVLKWGTNDDGAFVPLGAPEHTFANRQSLPPVYRPNGAVYVFHGGWLQERRSLVTDSIGMYVMDDVNSVDVDNFDDLQEGERLLAIRDRAGQ
jgi:CMP-N-acetylneuraminic acid synthetase